MRLYRIFNKLLTIVSKFVIFILTGILISVLCFFGGVYALDWLYPEANGSHNLGNNIYRIEWDGGDIIVYGTEIRGRTCYSGDGLIPTYKECYDEFGNWKENFNQWTDSTGVFSEYVCETAHNNKWITVKTKNEKTGKKKFYIIDKGFNPKNTMADQIIKKYIYEFDDSIKFATTVLSKGIDFSKR